VSYADFLASKRRVHHGVGVATDGIQLSPVLHDWQASMVRWALRKGRAAIFADCGLGKTFMQVSWAFALRVPTLILAPLCVAEQTVEQAAAIGIRVTYCQSQADIDAFVCRPDIVITNYERLDRFNPDAFGAVVLDESSILKAFDGKTRTALIKAFERTPYRLCCTATPSPNDIAELGNHAEFLGLMTRAEFLATWFVKIDQGLRTTEHYGWRLKGHARQPFWRWLASWAVALRTPSDIGYGDDGYLLPPLLVRDIVLRAEQPPEGALFHNMAVKGLSGRLAARRASLPDRVAAVADLTANDDQWLVWCGLNQESTALARAIPDAVEVTGADSYAEKVGAVQSFVKGDIRVLVSKVPILGFGMNFQHCHRMAFVGLGDSYEQYYQAIRRCWRFGQRHPVDVAIVVSEAEVGVVENVRRKEAAASALARELLLEMRDFERAEVCA
jgi:superfamily II DNA or RNA helicase